MKYDEIKVDMPENVAKEVERLSKEMGITEDEFVSNAVVLMAKMLKGKTIGKIRKMFKDIENS